jgi:AraC-like DNA-binding protein/catechol 2,3-dioxygenase-like lactoylglutathione lyase family enzyme
LHRRPLVADDVFRRLCRARDFVHEYHAGPVTLAQLARQAGLSRFHFLRLFRDAFGTTPHEYLTRVRLGRARALLAAEHHSVTEVCLDVGFSSLGSFSALFAERFGCPPSAWRRHFWQVAWPPAPADSLTVPWCFGTATATRSPPAERAKFRNIREARAHPPWHGGGEKEDSMIQRISHVSVFVTDQDRARTFYTEKLGFEVRTDATMGDFRWLTVGPKGQPDFELVLMALKPSEMMDEETCKTIRGLIEKGVFGAGVLETADIKKTYQELKSRGVEFSQEPTERPYGIEALLKDDTGNWFSMVQRR